VELTPLDEQTRMVTPRKCRNAAARFDL